MKYEVLHGKAEIRLKELADESIHAIVTDPPYHLTTDKKGGTGPASLNINSPAGRSRISTGFMGKQWDGGDIAFDPALWAECLRVLKPGGYLLAFGGARTYHRLACAIEDAGFEIRDQIMWVYGSGFPKSLDVSKAIDKAAGVERRVISEGRPVKRMIPGADQDATGSWIKDNGRVYVPTATEAATEAARKWEGWGTALKPAHEPIVVARKPLVGTVVANVLKYGTGAINIGACRIEGEPVPINKLEEWSGFGQMERPSYEQTMNTEGRWPANLIHDGSDEVLDAFPNAPGQLADIKYDADERKTGNIYGKMKRGHEPSADKIYTENGGTNFAMKPGARRLDTGSAARFFYCAKAGREDRNEGCEHLPESTASVQWDPTSAIGKEHLEKGWGKAKNNHPTVKPTDLMRYLVRLVTPPSGTVLDCFAGSGSTLKAALLEGFDCIGIEGEAEYIPIIKARCDHVLETKEPLFSQLTEDVVAS